MKLKSATTLILLFYAVLLIFSSPVLSADDPGFAISRMVMCEKISDREPYGIKDTFPDTTEVVYCFLEATNIEIDTTVSFVWYFEGQEKARVTLPLQKSKRWRTFSSKKLANLKGNWAVELQDELGIILNSVSFLVQ